MNKSMELLRNHNTIAILFFLLPLIGSANEDDEVKRGVDRLNALIVQNGINDVLGLSHLNKYIVRLDDDPNLKHIKFEKTVFIEQDLSAIDRELATLAIEYKIHFYIALNGSQLMIGKLNEQNQSVPIGQIDSASNALSNHVSKVLVRMYNESKISSLGDGKNILLGITPVQRVKVDLKDPTKDELYFTFLRKFIKGSAYPELINIIRYLYSSNDNVINTQYSRDPYAALNSQKELYVKMLKNYEEEVKTLYPGKTESAQSFYAAYVKEYYESVSIKQVMDDIGSLIDDDEQGFNELMDLMTNAQSLFGSIDVGVHYTYFNKDFTIIKNIGPRHEEFEAFKQSILMYKQYRQNVTELASQITCVPQSNESKDQFKARVYYCAALLTPATAANLTLEIRQNLLCALSTLELSRSWTVARDQLTTDEGKEEVVVRILVNTPEDQRKQLLGYFGKQTLPSGSLSIPIFWNLVSEIDSQNFQDMMLILIDWIQHYFPQRQQVWLDIIHNPERENRAILPLGTFRDGYSMGIASDQGKSIIQYHITENDIPIKPHQVTAGLLDYVVVKFEDSYTIGGKSFEEGSVHVVPSLLAYLIMHNMKVNTMVTVGKYTLYAAGLLVGVTEIVAAKTLLQATVALVDMGVASSDIVINEVLAEDLNKTEEGKEFLDSWNKYVLLYAGGRVVTQLSGVMDDLGSTATKINNDRVDEITKKILSNTDNAAGLAAYPSIRRNLGNSWTQQYLSNSQLIDFTNIIRNSHPDVLKYMNEIDEFDFAEMVRGYRDLLNNNKVATFKDAIKSSDNFYGKHGWINYWKLTQSIKYGMTTIEDLRNAGKLLGTGNATDIQLGSLQAFTAKGDFINIPIRYNKSFLGEYAEKGFNNVFECLAELRKVEGRLFKGRVFSGKAYSKAVFEKEFVGGTKKFHEYTSFVSASTDEPVAVAFVDLTKKWAGDDNVAKVAVIQRIVSKNGVYIDDISDWGKNLGSIRHADSPVEIQLQNEVLLNPGYLQQLSEPIPLIVNGEHIELHGLKAYYIDFLEI
jgi:hypothetical protein